MAEKPNYGVDAPNVIRNLLLAGAVCVVLALAVRSVTILHVRLDFYPGFLYSAAGFAVPAVLMLIYSKAGKFRHRDRILAKVKWTGTENVLDVGAGRGLLLIGAAKRLAMGHATGIDIWNAEDLSGNGPEGLLKNIALENVGGKTTVKSEDARQMSFADATFDVVLSNLCLHNIYQKPGRAAACREIARVLKPGGVAVISDYKHMREYETVLGKCGLAVEMCPPDWTGTFPPLRILVAHKPK
ncbi:MAG: class I SAM-dependent methyltransferase [Terracidiphilus sp.]|jgi:SAM-dependent methyltransferase